MALSMALFFSSLYLVSSQLQLSLVGNWPFNVLPPAIGSSFNICNSANSAKSKNAHLASSLSYVGHARSPKNHNPAPHGPGYGLVSFKDPF